jgi:hypothetical protein
VAWRPPPLADGVCVPAEPPPAEEGFAVVAFAGAGCDELPPPVEGRVTGVFGTTGFTVPVGSLSASPTVWAVLLTVFVTPVTVSFAAPGTSGSCGSWALAGPANAAASATVRTAVLRVKGRTRTPQ